MATTVGEAVIKLTFDGKDMKATLTNAEGLVEKSGKESGTLFGNALTVAAGNLISKGISKIFAEVTNNMNNAIKRVDILNNFPKIMSNMGISADEAQKSIDILSEKLQGLPTSLQDGASAVERFTSKNGDVAKSTDMFLALNNAILAGGAPLDIQSTALEQLSQAYAKGKPDMMEWRAIQSAMPAQLNQISKAMLGNSENLQNYMKLAQKYAKDNPMSSTASELVEQLEAVSEGTGDMTTALGTAMRTGIISMDEFMATIQDMNKSGVDGFQNLEEQARNSTGGIGTAMKNVENRIANAMGKVIQHIGSEKIANVINDISSHFTDLANAVITSIDFIVEHWDVIGPILATLGTVAGIIISINLALKAYHKIMGAVNTITTTFKKILGGVSSGISKVTQVFDKSPIGGAAEKVGGTFKKLSTTIQSVMGELGSILKSVVTAILEPIQTLLKGVADALSNFFKAFASPEVLLGAAGFAAAAGSIALAILMIGSAVGAVMPALEGLMNNIIIPLATFIADTVLGLIDSLTNAIVTITQQAFIPLGEFLANTFIAIMNTLTDVVVRLTTSAIVPLINTLSGAFIGILKTVGDILNGLVSNALNGVAEIVKATGVAFEGMGHGIEMALNGVDAILSTFADLIKSIADAVVAVVALVQGRSINYGQGYAHLFAEGGKVEGPGTSTSDSIPARLSNGEFVIKASSAKLIGYDILDDMNETGQLPSRAIVYNWAGVLANTISGTMESRTGGEINVFMTNQINNKLNAQDIGRTMIRSIREAA